MAIEIEPLKEEIEEMADGLSGAVGMALGSYLFQYVMEHNLGTVFNADTDFVLPNVGKRRPAIAFCSFETLPEPPRTVVPVPPDLAVEVVSNRDEIDNSDQKLREYLQTKIKLIWVVRPVLQVVEVYRNGEPFGLLGIDKELDGDNVIPGFKLPLSKLFTIPARAVN